MELEDIIKEAMEKKKKAEEASKADGEADNAAVKGKDAADTAEKSADKPVTERKPKQSASTEPQGKSDVKPAVKNKKPVKREASVSENFGKHSNNGKDKNDKKKEKKLWSVKKKVIVIIVSILGVLLVLAGIAALVIHIYINKMNLVDDSDSQSMLSQEDAKKLEEEDATGESDSPQEDIDDLEERIRKNLEENAVPLMQDENVINIMVIGSDSRGSDRGRSDSMILVSINTETKKIIMTSFLRDIYCSIPGYGSTRLNHAYAYGGADLLLDTLEQNFKIKIDKYVLVNFDSFVDVIDAMGGVTIDVTDAEVQYVNSYLAEINSLQGYDKTDSTLSSGGTYNLNGRQALAYSRIRYIGTDFGRTQRQRDVMEKVLVKAKNLGLVEMKDLLDTLLPEITTNLSEGEIFTLLLNAVSYLQYDTVSQCIPQDSDYSYMTIRGMSVLGIDFDNSISYLRKTIYDNE